MNKNGMEAGSNTCEDNSDELTRDQRVLSLLVLGLILLYSHLFGWSTPDWHNPRETPNLVSDSVYFWLSGKGIHDGLYRAPKKLLPPNSDSFAQLYLQIGLKPTPENHSTTVYDRNITDKKPETVYPALTVEDFMPPVLIPMPPQVALFFFQPISINKAGHELLAEIPGIGPNLAERIIALREEKGSFQKSAELLDVPGISQTKLDRLVEHISFN